MTYCITLVKPDKPATSVIDCARVLFFRRLYKQMFPATIGVLNARHRPKKWTHMPRKWAKDEEVTQPEMDATVGPGVRRAAEPKIGNKKVDPTEELAKEILGK